MYQGLRSKMDHRGDERTGSRNWQPHKTFLVDLDCSFGQYARPRCLNVETRETKYATHQVHKGNEQREIVEIASLSESSAVTPDIGKHCGRKTEGHNVSQR